MWASRQPAPLVFDSQESFANELNQARDSTYLIIPTGKDLCVKIGNQYLTVEQITQNVIAAVPIVVSKIPGEEKNIVSIQLSIGKSPLLPIYSFAIEHPAAVILQNKTAPSSNLRETAEEVKEFLEEPKKKIVRAKKNAKAAKSKK